MENELVMNTVHFLRKSIQTFKEGGEKFLFHAPSNEIYIVFFFFLHVNQCFALTLDSLNPEPDSFLQDF